MFAFLLSLKQSTMRSRGPNSVIDIVPEEFLAGLITAEHVIDVLVIFFSNSFLFDCKRCYRSNTVTNHFIHNQYGMELSGRYPIHDTKYSLKNLSPPRPCYKKNAPPPVRFSTTPGDVPSTLHKINIDFWKIKVILKPNCKQIFQHLLVQMMRFLYQCIYAPVLRAFLYWFRIQNPRIIVSLYMLYEIYKFSSLWSGN